MKGWNMFKSILGRSGNSEKGQALIVVLVLLTFGSLIIAGLLGFMGTGAKSGAVFHRKTAELYAADAGVQDAVWYLYHPASAPAGVIPTDIIKTGNLINLGSKVNGADVTVRMFYINDIPTYKVV